tara:strand:- start:108 stop:1883 length:1776 start_codon:yes stop_codon:yes gene_type:complete
MKSFYTLEQTKEYITKINEHHNFYIEHFIFKSDKSASDKNYMTANITSIYKFHNKITNQDKLLSQYINYNIPIKLYFILKPENVYKQEEILTKLNTKYEDYIIYILPSGLYLYIHLYLYFKNKQEYGIFLFTLNIDTIHIHLTNFIYTYNNIHSINNQHTFKLINNCTTYNFQFSIINNVKNCILIENHLPVLPTIISKKYVDSLDFNLNAELIFVKSSMGSGKSTCLVNYLLNNYDKTILILSSRRTLTNTIYNKLIQTNPLKPFDNYLLLNKYTTINSKHLIISPDSLIKLQQPFMKYDIIWIDEGTSLSSYLGLYPFSRKNEVIEIFIYIISIASQVIITDADINNNIIHIYKTLTDTEYNNIQYLFYDNFITLNSIYTNNNYNFDNVCDDILLDISLNKNIYICSDRLTQIESIVNKLTEFIDINDILIYTSNSPSEYDTLVVKGINNFWNKYKVVIVSPKVIYGIDFTEKHFHKIYCFYCGNIITRRECYQQINRIRNLIDKEVFIYIHNKKYNLVDDLYTLSSQLNIGNTTNIFSINIKPENILNNLEFNITNGMRQLNINNKKNIMYIYTILEYNFSMNNFIFI